MSSDSECCKPDYAKSARRIAGDSRTAAFSRTHRIVRHLEHLRRGERRGHRRLRKRQAGRAEYRRLIIKTVEGANDFASMNEAVFRRYKRLLNEEKPLPQLIFIDGGKGQISAAAAAMQSFGSGSDSDCRLGQTAEASQRNLASSALTAARTDRFSFEAGVAGFPARPANPRRNAQNGDPISPQTPRDARFHIGTDRDSRRRRKAQIKTSAKLRLDRTNRAKRRVEELTPFVGAKAAKEIFDHFERQRKLAAK